MEDGDQDQEEEEDGEGEEELDPTVAARRAQEHEFRIGCVGVSDSVPCCPLTIVIVVTELTVFLVHLSPCIRVPGARDACSTRSATVWASSSRA